MRFPWSRRAEIDEELQTHLQMAIRDRIERGESPEDAAINARREFGNELLVRETARDMWGWMRIERWGHYLRYACRQIRRSPGFAAIAISTLALGLGATSAVFSIVSSVLLEPLKYAQPERLYTVLNVPPPEAGNRYWFINPRHFHEWREHCNSCEDVAAAEGTAFTLTGSREPERLPGLRISYNFFRTFGVQPVLGRDFLREEELPGRSRELILSDSLWRTHFGADPGILDKTLQVNGEPYVVVGVMPSEFRLPVGAQWGWESGPALQPLMFRPLGQDVSSARGVGNNNFVCVFRLKDGAQASQVLSEFNASIADFVSQFNIQLEPTLFPLHDTVVRDARAGLWLLLLSVGAVLLIVCVNVGNLMLVRTANRDREVGIRMAIGSSRGQLFMLVLNEAMVLVALGSALGLFVAYAIVKAFVSRAPAGLPRVDDIHMGWPAFLFTIAAALVSTSICGLLPAWRMARTDPHQTLKTGALHATAHSGKLRFRELMVSVEVALSAVLLVVGGLLMLSFFNVLTTPKGFEMEHVITQDLSMLDPKYNDVARNRFIEDALVRLAAIPGVRSVGITNQIPLRGESWICDLRDLGTPDREAVGVANFRFVNPSYWDAFGIPLKDGRPIEPADRNHPVAVLSERTARTLWPGQNPVGKRVGSCGGELNQRGLEVIGVVGDVRAGIEKDAPLTVYQPFWTASFSRPFFTVRTPADTKTIMSEMRAVFRSLDPDLPLSQPTTMLEILDNAVAGRRFQLTLAIGFASAAILLAALGIYGVISFTVARRTPELGIRVALGARATQLRAMVLRQAMLPVIVGLSAGLACALLLGRYVASLLYGVSPYNPSIIVSVAAILLAVAVCACWIPARRAMRIDPLKALRFE